MNLRAIPKAELHRHLECSMRPSTLKELARAQGIKVPESDEEFKREFLVTEPMADLGAVLKKFMVTQQVINAPEVLTRITREIIEDCSAEGVRILELRYAPTFIEEGHEHLSFQQIHDAITAGVKACSHLPIAVGLLLIIQRIRSQEDAKRVTDFAIANKDSIVGLDLADNEVGFDCKLFAPYFQEAKAAGLKITVHAGEAPVPTASQSVYDAVEKLGADRIGHGVQIAKDEKAMAYIRERKIPLELCPISNWLTNAVESVAKHPFRKLMEAGVPVTLNTDDPGVFNTTLLDEYSNLEKLHGFTEAEFNHINDIAAAASFIPLEKKQAVWPRKINPSLVKG